MKILLLVTAFNSQTQAVYTKLKDSLHEVSVCFHRVEEQTLKEIEAFEPELILCPFLKSYISSQIYDAYPVYIFHPGPRGDRGPHSLEYALQSHTKKWGLVVLRANSELDGGDIYAEESFCVRETYKASLYRQEIVRASLDALDSLFVNIEKENFIAQELNPTHESLNAEQRGINWLHDTTQVIINKIYLSDSLPGVLDEILGISCYLFGVHKEDKLKGKPKDIIAKRDGAICIGTIDGAVWITYLKPLGGFKLPATYVLKEKLQGIKEERIPLVFDRSYDTFYEVSVKMRDNVGYLYFNFHNGAMSTAQCIRLKYAIEYLKTECEVLVLMGGEDFFSNGIHLNILEDSQKQGEDGWANINAMNDVVSAILYADEVLTVASFSSNAGAGGVFMGIACDYVVGEEGVVLNPHYKTLGLSGSEYHTYTLPKRVGEEISQSLLAECLPISVTYALSIGMLDKVFVHSDYLESLHAFAVSKFSDEFLWDKEEYLEENRALIEALKEKELEVMHPEFWDEKSEFHALRYEFVYKVCPECTPLRLK
ncbi:hydrogenase [Sulfurimonas sp. SAG-AH-194-L11]|nr:enoyl-CoA hydratase-related protein [Sulfurimonas sp. SAG-AH-194-L11]MDF1877348.1 hydrogenase [Sulfurimonas sp. SAG-AH-194-L11]